MPRRCIAFDRLVEADVPVIGALPAGDEDGPAIRIAWTAEVATPDDGPVWSGDAEMLDFAAPGIARYRCTAHGITVTPQPGASRETVDALLVATALPALLWMQGGFVLHAAAVVPAGGDAGLAIAGPSGIGKSTVAAALLERGARLLADDSVVLRLDTTRVTAAGLAGGYYEGSGDSGDRQFHMVPPTRACRSAPLYAIVVLDADPATGARLEGVAAVAALLANRHRASVPRLCRLEPHALRTAAGLAKVVQVYRWPRNEARALVDDDVRRAIMRGDR